MTAVRHGQAEAAQHPSGTPAVQLPGERAPLAQLAITVPATVVLYFELGRWSPRKAREDELAHEEKVRCEPAALGR